MFKIMDMKKWAVILRNMHAWDLREYSTVFYTNIFYSNKHKLERPKDITKIRLYNFDPLNPHFYPVKLRLRLTGVYIIILILLKKHRLSVLARTASPMRF